MNSLQQINGFSSDVMSDKHYPQFQEILGEIKKLEFKTICTQVDVKKIVRLENVLKERNMLVVENVQTTRPAIYLNNLR